MFFFGNWNIHEQSLCEADTNKHNQEHRFLMDMLLLAVDSTAESRLIITEESVHRSTLWVHQFTEQVRSTISGV